MRCILCLIIVLVMSIMVVPHPVSSAGTCSAVRGVEINVPGYGDRPAYLQVAANSTAPLVVMLHGRNGCVGSFQAVTGMDDGQPVSVLWVSGHNTPTGRQWDAWNGRVGSSTRGYLRDAVAATGLRPRSVVVAGISMGGFSSMWLACHMPDLFDGAFAVAGVTNASCPRSDTSLFMVVGARDSSIRGAVAADSGVELWSQVVTCDPAVARSSVGSVTTLSRTGCPGRVVVRAVVLAGVGHEWPEYPWFDTDRELVRFAFQIAPIPVHYPVRFV